MSIKQKVTLIISSLIMALIVLVFFSTRIFLLKNIETVERKKAEDSVENVISILKHDLASLNTSCGDWAQWDELYNFVRDDNQEFINRNLDKNSLSVLKVNSIIFTDSSGKLLYDKSFDIGYTKQITLPNEIKNLIYEGSLITQYKDKKDIISGIIMTTNGPMYLSSMPVTNKDGLTDGSLIMARYIDKEHIEWMNDVVDSQVSLIPKNPITDKEYSPFYTFNNYKLSSKIADKNTIYGYAEVKDINNKNSLMISANLPRFIFQQTYQNFKQFMYLFIFLITIFTLVTILAFQKVLLNRINKLYDFIKNIKSFEDISTRVHIKGNDEISKLAIGTNEMLNELEVSNIRILENEERLRLVLEGTRDGFWDVIIYSGEIFISYHIAEIFGLGKEDMYIKLKKLKTILASMNLVSISELYLKCLEKDSDNMFTLEQQVNNRETNEVTWILIKGRIVLRDEEGNAIRMAGTISDITQKKKSEETIKYLSKYDVLTNLCNRASFNAAIKRLDSKESLPLSIIMCDANGLKIVNDAFGHKAGDKLLIKIASILKEVSTEKYTAARLGGDEFAIIMPNTDEESASIICDNIAILCNNSETDPIKPSIAVGCVTKNNIEEDIDKLIDKAEDRMYRNKLLEDKSARHSIIASLERSLMETDFETREHTMRLQELAVNLGRKIGLSKDKLDELSLLGSLHDIGKIAIPKDILRKPGALNEEEWEIIKKHCEIGFRIAKSSLELVSIADGILSHHEKWNGTGYPKGLKGEEIPLLARIIAIVDAYDVITNDRPYKKAFTHEEAINEIIRCSGTHFDPVLSEEFVKLFDEENKAI